MFVGESFPYAGARPIIGPQALGVAKQGRPMKGKQDALNFSREAANWQILLQWSDMFCEEP